MQPVASLLLLPMLLAPMVAPGLPGLLALDAGRVVRDAVDIVAWMTRDEACPAPPETLRADDFAPAVGRLAAALDVPPVFAVEGLPEPLARAGAFLAGCAAAAHGLQVEVSARLPRAELPPLRGMPWEVDVHPPPIPSLREVLHHPIAVPVGAMPDEGLLAAGRMLDAAARRVAQQLAQEKGLSEGCWWVEAPQFDVVRLCVGDGVTMERDVVAVVVGDGALVRNNAGGAVGPATTVPHPYLGPPTAVALYVGSGHSFVAEREFVQGSGVLGGVGVLSIHGGGNRLQAPWSAQGWGFDGVGILRIGGGRNVLDTGSGHGIGSLGGLGLLDIEGGDNVLWGLSGGTGVAGIGLMAVRGGNNSFTCSRGLGVAGLGLALVEAGGNRFQLHPPCSGAAHGYGLLGGVGVLAIRGGGNDLEGGGLWQGTGTAGVGVLAIAGGGNRLSATEQGVGALAGLGMVLVDGGDNAFEATELQGQGDLGAGAIVVRGTPNHFSLALQFQPLPAGLGRVDAPRGEIGVVAELTGR